MDIIEICPFGCPFGFCDMFKKDQKGSKKVKKGQKPEYYSGFINNIQVLI